jgi:hypothetical protein
VGKRLRGGVAVAAALASGLLPLGLGLVGPAGPATAAGQSIKVTPSLNVSRAGSTFEVDGAGFSTTANGGFGVYVTFGPKPSLHPTDFWTKIDLYQASVWVHPTGSPNTATNRPMSSDGSFSFTLTNADGSKIEPVYGTTDCTKIQCGILTMAAHGVPDRSQDTFRPVIFSAEDPVNAKVGRPYATRVAPPAGVKPFTWTLTGGTIPPGLRLNASSGIISGTPTAEGVFRPRVRVRDASMPAQEVIRTVLIRVAPRKITVNPATLPARTVGTGLTRQLTATGGLAPYTFKVHSGALPPGMSLTTAGRLSGVPTRRGTFRFTVRALDKFAFAGTRNYSFVVN